MHLEKIHEEGSNRCFREQKEEPSMLDITATSRQIQALKNRLEDSERLGDFKIFTRCQALILYFEQRQNIDMIAHFMIKSSESIRLWIQEFAANGIKSLKMKIRIGREPKINKVQCKELYELLQESPTKHGFISGCWNSAMIQELIFRLYKIEYSKKYIPELMKRLGFSFQKAKFELNKAEPKARKKWMTNDWPKLMKIAKQNQSKIFFEDEVSFAMWGSLSYTWAPKGVQPTIKTSGNRKSYKVFGAIEYLSGRLIYQGEKGKLNASTYICFLKKILKHTKGHIILIHDGARYHTAKVVKEFVALKKERLTTVRLPAYSPDFNPIENLWRKAKRLGTHLVYFPTFEMLVNKVETTMKNLSRNNDDILNLFGVYRKQNT